MTIDEAIELLSNMDGNWPLTDVEDYDNAIKLGIEALKRIKKQRSHGSLTTWIPLPEETL